jgi:hypothetical protein
MRVCCIYDVCVELHMCVFLIAFTVALENMCCMILILDYMYKNVFLSTSFHCVIVSNRVDNRSQTFSVCE